MRRLLTWWRAQKWRAQNDPVVTLPSARIVKGDVSFDVRKAPSRGVACANCGALGHCPHRCSMIGWCHECDGPDCGGGCRNDRDCPKRMHVLASGKLPWELYPDEWTDEAIKAAGGRRPCDFPQGHPIDCDCGPEDLWW